MTPSSPNTLRTWLAPIGVGLVFTVLAWWAVGTWLLDPPPELSEVVAISAPAPALPVEDEVASAPTANEAEPPAESAERSDARSVDSPPTNEAATPDVVAVVPPEPVAEVIPVVPVESVVPPPPVQAPELPAVTQPASNNLASDDAEFRAEFDNTVEEQTIAEDAIAEGEVGPTEHQSSEPMEHVRGTSDVASELPEPMERVVAPDEYPRPELGEAERADGAGQQAAQARSGTEEGAQSDEPAAEARSASDGAAERIAAVDPADEQQPPQNELEGERPELVEGDGLPMPESGGASPAERSVAQAEATMRPNFEAMQASSGPLGEVGGVGAEGYTSVFGGQDDEARERLARGAREASIGGDSEGRWERTRGALENYDVAVTAGAETRLNTRADVTAGYIHALHNRIHEPWRAYLARLDREYGAANGVVDSNRFGPERGDALSSRGLSDPNLRVIVEIVIDSTGHVVDVNIARGSGALMFDAEAVDMIFRTGPHRPPPEPLLSFDGNTYVRWALHRDDRACGSFNASIRWRSAPSDTRGG